MKTTPVLYGLVLSGGKSTRMGTDKGILPYHGVPQREHMYHLLNEFCETTRLSIKTEQIATLTPKYSAVFDDTEYKGPYNGIMSAYEQYPDVAWLVMACDLPLMDLESIKTLINARNPEKMATVFATKESGLPEPLAAIWEPKGLKAAKDQLDVQPSGPRKFLMNADIQLVYPENDSVLMNANSEEEYINAIAKLTI